MTHLNASNLLNFESTNRFSRVKVGSVVSVKWQIVMQDHRPVITADINLDGESEYESYRVTPTEKSLLDCDYVLPTRKISACPIITGLHGRTLVTETLPLQGTHQLKREKDRTGLTYSLTNISCQLSSQD